MLDFTDFASLEQPEGNLMDAISGVWYNGSYTIAAKPIKTLELHYTMIQFLINTYILDSSLLGSDLKMSKSHVNAVSFDENVSHLSILFERNEHFLLETKQTSAQLTRSRETKELM